MTAIAETSGKKRNQEPAIGSANPESPLLRMSYTVLMADPRGISKTFTAVLDRSGDRLNWTVIRVPLDVVKIWGVRGQLRVRGEINGFAFRTSLFPDGKGGHVMIVNKKMQAGGKVAPGMKAKLSLEPDNATRKVTTPQELREVLDQSKRLNKYYESLSRSYRNYISNWVGEAS